MLIGKTVTSSVFTRINWTKMFHHEKQFSDQFRGDSTINVWNVTSKVFTNLYINFHEDWTITEASLKKNVPPTGGHVFLPTGTIFELVQDITRTHVLSKCHEDWTIDVNLRPRPLQTTGTIFELVQNISGTNPFQASGTIFELVKDTNATNLLTNFHDDQTIHVASRVLSREKCPNCGHVCQPTGTIFDLIQDIIGTNLLTKKNAPPCFSSIGNHFQTRPDIIGIILLTKFHNDQTINLTTRVLTRKKCHAPWRPWTNLLTKFYDDQTINIAPIGFSTDRNPFELIQNIIGTNVLTKFHEDWTIAVYFRVFTRKCPAPYIICTKLLTKCHEERTINMASRVSTKKMLTPQNARRTKGDYRE
ncbi:hypothetical protein DPMN_030619 [Dreissena polymorpha]|uniref:Uncharacterized protein n=1 Tax=Dreissena polymorpha TaxID=45954 RepID=A0A9D4M0A7_DREPO|nr:hypothetical protein DPMN_030619 [Dreissena polymorpha]